MSTVSWRSFSQLFTATGIMAFTCLAGSALPARAVTITVSVEVGDQVVLSDGSGRNAADGLGRVGLGYSTTYPGDLILPFKLPALPLGEHIVFATLSMNLDGGNNMYNHLRNVDLYGIRTAKTSDLANQSGHFVDGEDPDTNPQAVLLHDNFAVPADLIGSTGSGGTIPKLSEDIGWYVQALYDDGGVAGQYGFFTLTHDAALPLLRYYTFTSANSTIRPKPVLTLVTAAGGKSYYLDAANGADTNSGSGLSPWKTFNHAQIILAPGDTLYCTGEMGLINMRTTVGPAGENPYRTGTAENPITYKAWKGKSQPHIKRLVFSAPNDADKRDTHLSFEGFLFSPGPVDDADYVREVAIYLEGAWHIRFFQCDIEGASLDIDSENVSDDPTVSFTPYTPMSPHSNPAIASGGWASHVRIEECNIRNCGFGIMVTESARVATPPRVTRNSRDWIIRDNRISHASEDALRFAGREAGAGSVVEGNRISDQNAFQSALWWHGYAYEGEDSNPTIFEGRQWAKVQQMGTGATGVFYFTRYSRPEHVALGYLRFNILANDRTKVPLRNSSETWFLVDDPNIQFRPQSVGGDPGNGDSCHTDGIAIMSKMTGGIFRRNIVESSEWGGASFKIEDFAAETTPGVWVHNHPENLLFENNLFYSRKEPAVPAGGAMIIIAGGKNCHFVHNTILGGPKIKLESGIRFIDKYDDGAGFEGVYFYNNIISGGGASNRDGPVLGTSENNFWIQPPQPASGPKAGMPLGPGDQTLPAGFDKEEAVPLMMFQDAAVGDLRLTAGSPAQNIGQSGSPTRPVPNHDLNEYPRTPQPDAGAFEVGSPTSPVETEPPSP